MTAPVFNLANLSSLTITNTENKSHSLDGTHVIGPLSTMTLAQLNLTLTEFVDLYNTNAQLQALFGRKTLTNNVVQDKGQFVISPSLGASISATSTDNYIFTAPAKCQITSIGVVVGTTHAQHASNIWIFTATNSTGSTALLDNTDPLNSTISTTGQTLTANVVAPLSLTTTVADRVLVAGDTMLLTITKAASAIAMVNPKIIVQFEYIV